MRNACVISVPKVTRSAPWFIVNPFVHSIGAAVGERGTAGRAFERPDAAVFIHVTSQLFVTGKRGRAQVARVGSELSVYAVYMFLEKLRIGEISPAPVARPSLQ